jgi:predicted nucleic acid-binding protein
MRLVVDASVAIKLVIGEPDSEAAVALYRSARLIAPDLITAECANILWKKVRRSELHPDEAALAARLLQAADIELAPMRALLAEATELAVALDHPAYDCVYLALARAEDCPFVTADAALVRRVGQADAPSLPRTLGLQAGRDLAVASRR